MERLDDQYDAAKKAFPEQKRNTAWQLALKVSGPFVPPIAVVNEVRDHFSQEAFKERVEALSDALNEKIECERREREKLENAVDDLQARLDSPEFLESFREACLQTLLTSDMERVQRFGEILGGSIVADNWPKAAEDAASFVKAVAQLADRDIQALRILYNVFSEEVRVYPNLHDPNPFTERAQELLRAAETAGFHRDDFYSHCRRLEGFGLAMEVPRNPSRMAPGDYCFRPTLFGLRLIRLLSK